MRGCFSGSTLAVGDVLRVHVAVVLNFLLRTAAALGLVSARSRSARAEEHGIDIADIGEHPRSRGQHSVWTACHLYARPRPSHVRASVGILASGSGV